MLKGITHILTQLLQQWSPLHETKLIRWLFFVFVDRGIVMKTNYKSLSLNEDFVTYFVGPVSIWHLFVQIQKWKQYHCNDIVLVSLLLTFNKFHALFWTSKCQMCYGSSYAYHFFPSCFRFKISTKIFTSSSCHYYRMKCEGRNKYWNFQNGYLIHMKLQAEN